MQTIERQKHVIDAKGQTVGRLATEVVRLLRGKNKAIFEPQADLGDEVSVINAGQMKFTGNKVAQKIYYRHSGYPNGGLKQELLAKKLLKNPSEVVKLAVLGMLPKNKLRSMMIKRLKIEN